MNPNSKLQVYAFIDSQNLNLGTRAEGWKLDFRKFYLYLQKEYNVSKAYLFIGQVAGNETMYQSLEEMGYTLVFKPTMQYIKNGKEITTGNVDAELVLYASAMTFNYYDEAIIVSGDGDFYCLIEYLEDKDKLLKVLVPNGHYSSLLKPYADKIVRVDQLKNF